MYTLSVYIAGEIDLFENLDIVHIKLLVVVTRDEALGQTVSREALGCGVRSRRHARSTASRPLRRRGYPLVRALPQG